MEKQPALLVATDIYKNYGNISVLKGVSLEVNKAEMVSIVGASGAGKSTLLYIVSSLEKADKGKFYSKIKTLVRSPINSLPNIEITKLASFFNFIIYYLNLRHSRMFVYPPGLVKNQKHKWKQRRWNYLTLWVWLIKKIKSLIVYLEENNKELR